MAVKLYAPPTTVQWRCIIS